MVKPQKVTMFSFEQPRTGACVARPARHHAAECDDQSSGVPHAVQRAGDVLLDALNTPVQDNPGRGWKCLKYSISNCNPASRSPSTPWHDR